MTFILSFLKLIKAQGRIDHQRQLSSRPRRDSWEEHDGQFCHRGISAAGSGRLRLRGRKFEAWFQGRRPALHRPPLRPPVGRLLRGLGLQTGSLFLFLALAFTANCICDIPCLSTGWVWSLYCPQTKQYRDKNLGRARIRTRAAGSG